MRLHYLLTVAIVCFAPTLAFAQSAGSEEDVQFRSIDFGSQVLELYNFGSSTLNLDGWIFCSHDVSDGFDYSSGAGLNGVSLAAGESLNIHWNDDASGANALNISDIGGNWVDDLTVNGAGDGISINLYRDSSFGSSTSIIDHIQYSYDGVDVGGQSNPRGGVAVGGGLWSATSDWVEVSSETTGLVLVDDPFPGATGETHGSASYIAAVPEPSSVLALVAGFFGLSLRRQRHQS